MHTALIQRPTLYFYHYDTGNFIDKCDYINTYNEHYDRTLYAPFERNITLISKVLDDDLINIIRSSKNIDMYAVFEGIDVDETKQIKVVYKYSNIVIDSISYELQNECDMTDFFVNLLALNRVRVSEKELPNKIYQEMKENE